MKRPLKCFLIEDEPLALRQLRSYITKWGELELIDSVCNVEENDLILSNILQCEVLFLDLIVTGGNISFLEPHVANLRHIVVISALPSQYFPPFIINCDPFILKKPITPSQFDSCITIILELEHISKYPQN